MCASDVLAVIAVVIAVVAAGAAVLGWRQVKRANDDAGLARSARLDIGMQQMLPGSGPDGGGGLREQVAVVNLGPATASQVMVEVEHGGTVSGQGVQILPQGEMFTAEWDCREQDITKVHVHWNDDRGKAQSKSWGPGSSAWPLKPWLLRVMVARDKSGQ